MRLSRRALLSVAAALGISGRAAAEEGEDTEEWTIYGEGIYGEGLYAAEGRRKSDDDAVDECFIATAAEGTIDHPHVVQLRAFRDATLRSSVPGRLFIRGYYATSPPVARWIARSDRRRQITSKWLVRPLSRAVTAADLTH